MFHNIKSRRYLNLFVSNKIIIKKQLHVTKNQKFLFGNNYSKYADTDLNSDLALALETNDIIFSTTIQAKVFPHIMDGTDIIIGAETGSGKTLAYLIPLIHKYMNLPKKIDILKNIKSDDISVDLEIHKPCLNPVGYPEVVILVPNKELVNQVYSVGKGIIDSLPNNESNIKIGN
jgi:superfamily II DNA/RNA helicase